MESVFVSQQKWYEPRKLDKKLSGFYYVYTKKETKIITWLAILKVMRTEGVDALSKCKSVVDRHIWEDRKKYQATEWTGKTQKRKRGTATGGSIAKKSESLSKGKECSTTRD